MAQREVVNVKRADRDGLGRLEGARTSVRFNSTGWRISNTSLMKSDTGPVKRARGRPARGAKEA